MSDRANIYQDGTVTVSKTLVRVKGHTYPVNGIGSVYIKKPFRWIWLGIGAVILLASLGGSDPTVGAVVGGILIAVGLLMKSRLIIRTASGDQSVLTAFGPGALQPVKIAIETAVEQRG